jgi:DNA-binding response OmpR family regulator
MSGEEALKLFKEKEPDLVVLDINMPGMDGIEVLRQMKQMKPDVPVILSSAYPEYKQDLASWASDDYIVKSFSMDELKESVRKHLQKKGA